MKNKYTLISAFALLMLIVSPMSAQGRNSSITIAIVRGEVISLDEIKRREAFLTRNRPAQEGSDELRRLAIKHVIRERILLQAAVAEGISITDSDVTEYVSDMQRGARDAGATEAVAAFRDAAAALGLTENEFPRNLK